MEELKIVYKCFQVARSCETCKFVKCDSPVIGEVTLKGVCTVGSGIVNLKDDCGSWDFDDELLDDAFWIVKLNGGVK